MCKRLFSFISGRQSRSPREHNLDQNVIENETSSLYDIFPHFVVMCVAVIGVLIVLGIVLGIYVRRRLRRRNKKSSKTPENNAPNMEDQVLVVSNGSNMIAPQAFILCQNTLRPAHMGCRTFEQIPTAPPPPQAYVDGQYNPMQYRPQAYPSSMEACEQPQHVRPIYGGRTFAQSPY